SGQLYHQLFVNDQAIAFAHSRFDPNGAASITRIARSSLPARIDQAVSELDVIAPDAVEVRLLKTRIYQVNALWLHGDEHDRLYVVSVPSFFRNVPLRELITPEQFVTALAQEEQSLRRRSRSIDEALDTLAAHRRGERMQGILTVSGDVFSVNDSSALSLS